MNTAAKCLVSLSIACASQAAWAATLLLPADAQLDYTGQDESAAPCTIQIVTDPLSRPVSVRLDLVNPLPGNVRGLDVTFTYGPLLSNAATIVPTLDGFSVSATMLTTGVVEIDTAAFASGEEQSLTAVTVTRNFVGILGATMSCKQLQPL